MSSFKRVIGIVVALLLVIGLVHASALAKASSGVEYSVYGADKLAVGGTGEYTLKATGMSTVTGGVTGYKITLFYDASRLSLVSVSSLLSSTDFQVSINTDTPGQIVLVAVSAQPITLSEQSLLSIELGMKDAGLESTQVSFTGDQIFCLDQTSGYIDAVATSLNKSITPIIYENLPGRVFISVTRIS